MGKTIAIIGTIDNVEVKKYIVEEVNAFFKANFQFGDLLKVANSYIMPENDKIATEAIEQYINNLAATNLNYDKKLGLIYNFELISVLNQNKLLKTFEDNPENTLQIIVVSRENKLISTIKSRMLIVDKRTEKLSYSCLDKEKQFYQEIIKQQKEADYLSENSEIKNTIIAIYNELNCGNVTNAFILYTSKISDYNKTVNLLVIRIIYNYLYAQQEITQLIKLFDYEQRFEYNVNERVQVEALFVEIRGVKNE